MKRKYRDYLILTITVLVIVFISIYKGYLFGSNTDWVNQHTILPDYFRQFFYKTGNLIPDFTLNYSSGENIFDLSYYGFLSPIILPSYLLPSIDMVTYMTIVDILVVIFSGILFYKWLKNNDYNDDISLITSLLFVTAGPLIFHMHRHVMFVNYMPFLIMSLMGVDSYLKNDKKALLVISIFLMIMTSYYYSIGGILVTCIYYIYKFLNTNKDKFVKRSIIFALLIILAIILSSILLLPTAYTLLSGRTSSESISIIKLIIPNLGIHRIFCGTYSIGLSLIGFVALLYLFMTKKKEDTILGILISLILFSPIFMYILNGGLYLKEKCFIPFLPLIAYILAYFLSNLEKNNIDTKKLGNLILISFLVVFTSNMNRICMLELIAYGLIFLKYDRKIYKLLIIFLLLLSTSTLIIENMYEDRMSKDLYNEIFDKNIEETIKETLSKDNTLFRSNNLHYSTKTINKIYNDNYYTTNTYSSTYNRTYLNFIKKTFRTSSKDYNYFMVSPQNNIMFNTFFGYKYLYSDYDLGLGYEKINGMYKNEDVLPIMYASSHLLSESEFDELKFPKNQEALINNVIVDETSNDIDTNIEKVDLNYEIVNKKGVEIKKKGKGYVIEVEKDGLIEIKIDELKDKILFISLMGLKENSCKEDNISIKIKNIENILTCETWPYPNNNHIFRYAISDSKINTLKVELTKGTYNISKIDTYTLDYKYIKNIKNNITLFNNLSYKDGKFIGDIDIKEYSYLVTTIPYDKGFTIKANGKEMGYEMINKGFIGLPLEKGTYEIEISYKAPLLKESKILSAFALLPLVIVILEDKFKKKPN